MKQYMAFRLVMAAFLAIAALFLGAVGGTLLFSNTLTGASGILLEVPFWMRVFGALLFGGAVWLYLAAFRVNMEFQPEKGVKFLLEDKYRDHACHGPNRADRRPCPRC